MNKNNLQRGIRRNGNNDIRNYIQQHLNDLCGDAWMGQDSVRIFTVSGCRSGKNSKLKK